MIFGMRGLVVVVAFALGGCVTAAEQSVPTPLLNAAADATAPDARGNDSAASDGGVTEAQVPEASVDATTPDVDADTCACAYGTCEASPSGQQYCSCERGNASDDAYCASQGHPTLHFVGCDPTFTPDKPGCVNVSGGLNCCP